MKKITVASAKPGDLVASPVWSENGTIIVGAGVELNDRYIERLTRLGVEHLYIDDKTTMDIVAEEVLQKDETRKKAVDSVYKTIIGLEKEKPGFNRATSADMAESFNRSFGDILGEVSNRKEVLAHLINLYVKDAYLFHHSINVAVLAGIIGVAKRYDRNQMLDLIVGALLFDIGMTVFPSDLLQKSTDLTKEQRERIRRHTEEGFDILRDTEGISLLSAQCALQHHERFDGTGYPRGLKGEEIQEFAQIVGIADLYDALITPRPYRKSFSPSEAVELLYAVGNQYFDIELVRLFCQHIAIYPVSTKVLLNTGQVGVISAVNRFAVHRPVIQVTQGPDGTVLASPIEINLEKQLNITITKTL